MRGCREAWLVSMMCPTLAMNASSRACGLMRARALAHSGLPLPTLSHGVKWRFLMFVSRMRLRFACLYVHGGVACNCCSQTFGCESGQVR